MKGNKRWWRLAAATVLMAVLVSVSAKGDKKFILALDPGHTPERPGAVSARGREERLFNRELANAVAAAVTSEPGLEVFLTIQPDENIANSERARRANNAGADLFLSIHHDSVQEIFLETWEYQGRNLQYCDRFSGYSIFISSENSPGYCFARALGDRLNAAGFHPTAYHALDVPGERMTLLDPTRGIYLHSKRLTVLTRTSMPAVLLEAGFIKNRDEELLLSDPERKKNMAEAVGLAVQDYRGKCLRK